MARDDRLVVKKLSSAVLELKFMKKTKEKADALKEKEETQLLYRDQLSSLHDRADQIIQVGSYFDCKEFLPCRLSFGGFDPEIEKLNYDSLKGVYKPTKPLVTQTKVESKMEADTSEREIAENYSNLLGTKAAASFKRSQDEITDESFENFKKAKKEPQGSLGRQLYKNFNPANNDMSPYRGKSDNNGSFKGSPQNHNKSHNNFSSNRQGNHNGKNRNFNRDFSRGRGQRGGNRGSHSRNAS